MKKVVLFVLLIAGIAFNSKAQKFKFYYYPASNVYYNASQHKYAYLNKGSWIETPGLPAGKNAAGGSRYIVYSSSPKIWVKNEAHVKKYKAPKYQHLPKGKAVGYKGSHPNKALGTGKGHGHKNGKH